MHTRIHLTKNLFYYPENHANPENHGSKNTYTTTKPRRVLRAFSTFRDSDNNDDTRPLRSTNWEVYAIIKDSPVQTIYIVGCKLALIYERYVEPIK